MKISLDLKKQLERHSNKPTRDAIFTVLKTVILEGHLQPGDKITEDGLARQLDCSRTPVREALRKLESERLVKVKPGVGMEISTIDIEMVEQEFDIRKMLEIYAVEKASENITVERIMRLEWVTDKIQTYLEEKDFIGATQSNIEFHELLFAYAGNQLLTKIKDLLWVSMRLSFLASNSGQRLVIDPCDSERLQEHRELITALRNRDKQSCIDITNRHIQHTYQYCLEFMRQRNENLNCM